MREAWAAENQGKSSWTEKNGGWQRSGACPPFCFLSPACKAAGASFKKGIQFLKSIVGEGEDSHPQNGTRRIGSDVCVQNWSEGGAVRRYATEERKA